VGTLLGDAWRLVRDTVEARVPAARALRGRDPALGGDYPAVFWLAWLASSATRVCDLGGQVSAAVRQHRRYLKIPDSVQWTVCPARFADADASDVLFACGASLERMPLPLHRRLLRLARKPVHVVVNRVPFDEQDPFQRILFRGGMERAGYELLDEWDNGRAGGLDFSGMYFRLGRTQLNALPSARSADARY